MPHDTSPATPRMLRSFALTVGGAFVALGVLLHLRGRAAWWVLVGLGVALALAGLVVPARLGPLYRVWMRIALGISRVTTPVFMGIVYFAVLTPLGVAMRLVGRRPLARDPGASSFWVARLKGERKSDLKRQF